MPVDLGAGPPVRAPQFYSRLSPAGLRTDDALPWTCNRRMATCLHNLASLRDDQGKRSEARSLYERSLAIKRRIHGRNHPDTVVTLQNLALTLHAEGDFKRPLALFEEALAIAEKMLGADHADTNRVRSNFARVLFAVGKFPEASRVGAAALAAYRKDPRTQPFHY
jgi:tetratricopeptide (TPR) repeat protein